MKAYTLLAITSFGLSMPPILLAQVQEGHEAHHPGGGKGPPRAHPSKHRVRKPPL